jgi:hypothetical protein
MSTIEDIQTVLSGFVDDLADRLSPHDFELVLAGKKDDLEGRDLGQKPERYTEDELVYPLLEAVGLAYDAQLYAEAGDRVQWPDFGLANVENDIIGENKALNNVEEGVSQIKDYLDRKSIGAEYGIVTDGIEWYLYKIELGGDFTEYPEIEHIDLRPAIQVIAREAGYLAQAGIEETDTDEEVATFIDVFDRDAFEQLLSQDAPQRIRDQRKRDVDEFYELYIEYLFGESSKYDYETTLLDDIRSPPGANDRDERLFAITLMNRLLFIKFLETREILPNGFLRERVDHYKNSDAPPLAGNLYETQIRPLFYKLFNTPEDEREPKYRTDWFADVPYLNGGLFRENIENEAQYTVIDRILPEVIADLIEGSKLELNGRGFDPALIGSVFEKTINHIEQERTQKDIGAYYTPNDVTDIITRETVDPRIRDALIEAFVEELSNNEEQEEIVRGNLESMELAEILRAIEGREKEEGKEHTGPEGWFASPAAIREANDRLSKLRVLDPACGSGHFLTAAMDEIYRAQQALLRGLSGGDDPDPADRYATKKNLALNAIYGVDVDRIATEIAKLRVWLKIVEGQGWDPEFGRLPNIDVNIIAGNSLVGLPATGVVESVEIWDDRVAEVAERRRQYKFEDKGERREIEAFLNEIRPELNREFLKRFNRTLETEVTSVEQFNAITESIEELGETTLYPTVESVQVQRRDSEGSQENLTNEEQDTLEARGFNTYTKSARLSVEKRESELKNGGTANVREVLASELRELLESGFVFSEFKRRPLSHDLDNILGHPFHWIIEFPEVTEQDGNTHSIDFDVMLANPPYGDLINNAERLFVSTYETKGINEISANFVERQLQLLDQGGYIGNVTTLRLIYQSSLDDLHNLMRRELGETRIACFGSRPSRIFDNADVRASIITGEKATRDSDLYISDGIVFTEENRKQKLSNIEYSGTDGFVLRNKIGGEKGSSSILPKIGPEIKKSIIRKLESASTTVFRDKYVRDLESEDESEHPVWRREGVRYWISPMLEELYSAREVKPMYFETELERNAAFIVMSSSLYYVYWLTYGNFHHLNWMQIEAFPFPADEKLKQHEDQINTLAEKLWTEMKTRFDSSHGIKGEFHIRPLKPLIDEIDDLMAELYGLTDDEVEFVKTYLTDCGSEYGRAGPTDERLEDAIHSNTGR